MATRTIQPLRVLRIVVFTASALLTTATLFDRANVLSAVDGRAAALAAAGAWMLTVLLHLAPGAQGSEGHTRRASGVRLLLGGGAVWAVVAVVHLVIPAGSGLAAQYFENVSFTGPAVRSVVDHAPSTSQVRARWDGVPPAAFSVVWTGYITATRAGRFGFVTRSDDGSWLHVDDQLVVDNGGAHGASPAAGEIDLSEGPHRIVLQYVQQGGDFEFGWSWTPPGGGTSGVPAWALSRRRAPVMAARAAQVIDWAQWLLALAVATLGVSVGAAYGTSPLMARLRQAWRWGAAGYRSDVAFAAALFVWISLLFLPRSGEGGLYRAVVETVKELHTATLAGLGDLSSFRSNLDTPRSGEREVLPGTAVEVVAMLDAHGLTTFRLAPSMYSNEWVIQQVVASAWPRRLEPDAHALFIWNEDAVPPGCTLRDRAKEVRLVACP